MNQGKPKQMSTLRTARYSKPSIFIERRQPVNMLTVYTEESLITNDLQLMCFNDNYFRLNFINRKHPYDETILNLIRTIDGAQQVEGKNKDKFYSKFGGEIAVDARLPGVKPLLTFILLIA